MNDQIRPPFQRGDYIRRLDVEGYPSVTPGRIYRVDREEICASDGCTVGIINDNGEPAVYGSGAFEVSSEGAFKVQAATDTWLMETPTQGDAVVLPDHYARWKIEPILFIRENDLPFWMGNVIKYVIRAEHKNGLEDLKKARRYLDMEIARMEGREDWNR